MAKKVSDERLSLSRDTSLKLQKNARRMGVTEDIALSQAVDLLSIAFRVNSAGLQLTIKRG